MVGCSTTTGFCIPTCKGKPCTCHTGFRIRFYSVLSSRSYICIRGSACSTIWAVGHAEGRKRRPLCIQSDISCYGEVITCLVGSSASIGRRVPAGKSVSRTCYSNICIRFYSVLSSRSYASICRTTCPAVWIISYGKGRLLSPLCI